MLADDLADCPQLFRLAVIGTEPPDDLAVASDDCEKTRLTAADQDVVRREARVALIEPAVRADVGRRVRVEPVETAARAVEGAGGLDRAPCVRAEAELVDVIARQPLPRHAAGWRKLDEAIVFERDVRDVRLHAPSVREHERVTLKGRRALG